MVHKYCYHQYNGITSKYHVITISCCYCTLVKPQHFSSVLLWLYNQGLCVQNNIYPWILLYPLYCWKKSPQQRTMIMIFQGFKGLSKIEGFAFELLVIKEACCWVLLCCSFEPWGSYRRKNTDYLCSCLYFPVNFINNITIV